MFGRKGPGGRGQEAPVPARRPRVARHYDAGYRNPPHFPPAELLALTLLEDSRLAAIELAGAMDRAAARQVLREMITDTGGDPLACFWAAYARAHGATPL